MSEGKPNDPAHPVPWSPMRFLTWSSLWYSGMLVVAVGLFLLINAWGANLAAPAPAALPRQGRAPEAGELDAVVRVLIALAAVVLRGGLLALLFRCVGQPPVIGEVVAGILLGPSFLGQVWPEAAAFVLPPSVAP